MPGEPGSRLDVKFCHDVARIADALERIAQAVQPRREGQQVVESLGEIVLMLERLSGVQSSND